MKLMNNCIVLASFTSLLLTTVTDSFSSHQYHQMMTIGFSSHRHHHHPAATISTATICPLMMTPRPLSQSQLQQSRRDILLATFSSTATVAVAAVAALVIAPTAVEAAPSKAPAVITYEGFYVDPKSPEGLRLLRKKIDTDVSVSGGTAFDAIMTKSDGVMKEMTRGNVTAVEMVYEDIPVSVNGNELTFDITIKGGPTESLLGKLSGDGTKLTFPDGNIWTKK